jgi:hypothetical protein
MSGFKVYESKSKLGPWMGARISNEHIKTMRKSISTVLKESINDEEEKHELLDEKERE